MVLGAIMAIGGTAAQAVIPPPAPAVSVPSVSPVRPVDPPKPRAAQLASSPSLGGGMLLALANEAPKAAPASAASAAVTAAPTNDGQAAAASAAVQTQVRAARQLSTGFAAGSPIVPQLMGAQAAALTAPPAVRAPVSSVISAYGSASAPSASANTQARVA